MNQSALIRTKPSASSATARRLASPSFGTLQRKCACGGAGGSCPECRKKEQQLQRSSAGTAAESTTVPSVVHEVLRSPGQPLDSRTRAFFEPRFGHDFSAVRIHADGKAAESAHAVGASAWTVGNNVVFGAGRHEPSTIEGRRLLAHELTHVVQQQGMPVSSNLRLGSTSDPAETEAENIAAVMDQSAPVSVRQTSELIQRQTDQSADNVPTSSAVQNDPAPHTPAPSERPETCPPPADLVCPVGAAPSGVTNTIVFPVNSETLNATQRAEIDRAAAAWHRAGASGTIRADGYASAEYECEYNWRLSCRRAQAVAAELAHPSDGSAGVPTGNISVFSHGESDAAGAALAPNRRVTISMPAAPSPTPHPTPTPPPSPSATCSMPVSLGVGRTGCGSGTDFTHFDFPSISAASEAKLAAWAAAHPTWTGIPDPRRSSVSDADCELEMDGVLAALAGGSGHAAFTRFAAGTGGTETLGPGTDLGADALASGSFSTTLASVKTSIESQLATQAAGGALNPCALSVVPPATHFSFSDGRKLKAVIGGTHGERLNATAFTGDIPTRTYSINLQFLICDNFGVDEADLYAPGLFAFWVLQHERSASKYAPFINLLDLPVTVSGSF